MISPFLKLSLRGNKFETNGSIQSIDNYTTHLKYWFIDSTRTHFQRIMFSGCGILKRRMLLILQNRPFQIFSQLLLVSYCEKRLLNTEIDIFNFNTYIKYRYALDNKCSVC